MSALNFVNEKAGRECWAWQYDWPEGLSQPLLAIKPVRGILTEQSDKIGDTTRGPGWFVPYVKKSRRPAFTKAIRVEAVNLDSDQTGAEDGYNNAVRKVMSRFLNDAGLAQYDLIPTERDGFIHGNLENYPVLRPDLTRDYSGITAAAKPILELKSDHEGDLMAWENFIGLIQSGCINRYDGIATFRLNDKGCDNAIIDMWRDLVYIPDQYAIPFEQVPIVFANHNPEILWFNK